MTTPLVSVIIVNYNGRHLIKSCLDSILVANFPQDKLEIIVVDNNSTDDSVTFIKRYYPQIKLIESEENLGFTGGNNLGLNHSLGKYIALLNSDTKVDPNWLTEMLKIFSRDKKNKIAVVSPKIYYHIPFIQIEIESNVISQSDLDGSANFLPLGVLMADIRCSSDKLSNQVWYLSGFHSQNKGHLPLRWTNGRATVLLPFPTGSAQTYLFNFFGYQKEGVKNQVSIKINGKKLAQVSIEPYQSKSVLLTIQEKLAKQNWSFFVQNAGNAVLKNGYGKDIGNTLKLVNEERFEFYDFDNEYYQQQRNLLAFCGAACLIKREVLKQTDFFDGYYFMYYEDLELSLRLWRRGWNIVYTPNSIVYHQHRATTGKEPTGFFINLIERNHLSFLLTHFSLLTFFIELLLFFTRYLASHLMLFSYKFRENIVRERYWQARAGGRSLAMKYLLKNIVRLYQTRLKGDRFAQRTKTEMNQFLY